MWAGGNQTGEDLPNQTIICNGAAISRTTYVDLFEIIGTSYGAGDGSSTFNVPDLRGRFPLGADNMGGSSGNRVTLAQADTVGDSGGSESSVASHQHNLRSSSDYSIFGFAAGGSFNPGGPSVEGNTDSAGTSSGNIPPFQTMSYLIQA